ncbi:MAG: hypothetical protein CL776_00095 [Chloroflexi bacterium]|nr:hypothetical protein [Chloroflexota bacterium]
MSTPDSNKQSPLHSDIRPLAIVDIITIALGGFMLFSGLSGNSLSLLFGIVAIGYVLFFTHARYLLFNDTLVIKYRMVRTRLVPVSEINIVETVNVALVGTSVFLVLNSGSRIFIKPRDPVAFAEQIKRITNK